ncbi:TetR family transcriptional regulator [Thermanaerosceptrum fracticalcis]|uniref:TetR family transcriptional regulator n=1 Tax=Thermanaerosceptrum fracticalcis TaxID=1712410 RepID=A0A7G6E381_THEFR|nr:TetR/AcrR family transcriptional regulator [Thermanaerosceptrum fracticalcis]QNB46535.1 TetR family transcriptional regulator [Thermanaerosceptrum fracticalcis]
MPDTEQKKGSPIRERIIAAFIELSKSKGFYRVTMDELSAQAGVSKRTIYRYFTSKEEVIEAVIDSIIQRVAREMDRVMAEAHTPAELIAQALQNLYLHGHDLVFNPLIMEDLRSRYPHFWKKIDSYRMEKAQNLIKAILSKSDKDLTREIDPRIMSTAFLAAIQAVVNPEFTLKNGLTLQDALNQVVDLFTCGFIRQYPGS